MPNYAAIALRAFQKEVNQTYDYMGCMSLSGLIENNAAEIIQHIFNEAYKYAVC